MRLPRKRSNVGRALHAETCVGQSPTYPTLVHIKQCRACSAHRNLCPPVSGKARPTLLSSASSNVGRALHAETCVGQSPTYSGLRCALAPRGHGNC